MKKLLAIVLVIVMVFALAACTGNTGTPSGSGGGSSSGGDSSGGGSSSGGDSSGGGGGDSAAPGKDILNVAFTQDRGTLDPMYMLGYDNLNGLRMIYESLWDFDQEGNIVWMLATGIEYVEPTVWHITLREGITFQNGNPFNAEDALFSILRGNNRVGEPPYLPELDMEKSNVFDEYTVELIFNSYDLSYISGMSSLFMFDVESFNEEAMAKETNGTGPYELTEYVINSHMNMTAREGYWGEAPKIKNISFKILSEDAQRVNALQTGAVDICSVPYQDVEFVQTLPGINVELSSAAYGMSSTLYMNPAPTSVFYDNVDARKAVALAIDREAIVDIAYSGFSQPSRMPMSQACVDDEERFMDMGVYGIGYNPEMAKELAISSGLIDKSIKLINNGSAANVATCELIQANLREIGVACEILNLDPGSWLSYAFDETAFDMCVDFTAAPSMTMAQNYYSWVTYAVGGAYLRYPWPGNERFAELTDGIMSISDAAELSERYMELTQIHTDAMLWFSLVDIQLANAYSADLKGYVPYLAGNVDYSKLSW